MRRVLPLVLATGCAQLLGISDPKGSHGDDVPTKDGSMPGDGGGPEDCARVPSFGSNDALGGPMGAVSFAVGDLDHDGFPDIAIVSKNLAEVTILHGKAGGKIGSTTSLAMLPGASGATFVAIADMDDDGFDDLLYRMVGTDSAIIQQRQVPGGFDAREILLEVGPMFGSFAVGNVDHDSQKLLDLVAPDPSQNGIQVTFQNSQDSFGMPVDASFGSPGVPPSEPVVLADLDHDGLLDPIGLSGGSVAFVLHKPGVPQGFAPSQTIGPQATTAVAAGDLDGDGFDDVVAAAGDQLVPLFQDPGKPGTFAAGSPIPAPTGLDLAMIDVNGDGRLDLVSHGVAVLQCGPASGVREFGPTLPAIQGGYADLNGDGRADIIELDPSQGLVTIRLQQ